MKYVSFVIGVILVILIGAFVWNVISDVFIGVNTNIFDEGNSSQDIESTTPISQREGVVSISSIKSYSSLNRPQEIILQANLDEDEVVDITGWMIQTNQTKVNIPAAVNFYDVAGFNRESVIELGKGDEVRIKFDRGPVSKNLRLNQCTGYLNEKYNLDNVFPTDCPRVEKEKYKHLSGDCQDYINDINGDCITPDLETLNSFPKSKEGDACRSFLTNHFNTEYCMSSNKDNDNFLSDQWRVWINKSRVLDSKHDWVRLYNKNGILIDEREY